MRASVVSNAVAMVDHASTRSASIVTGTSSENFPETSYHDCVGWLASGKMIPADHAWNRTDAHRITPSVTKRSGSLSSGINVHDGSLRRPLGSSTWGGWAKKSSSTKQSGVTVKVGVCERSRTKPQYECTYGRSSGWGSASKRLSGGVLGLRARSGCCAKVPRRSATRARRPGRFRRRSSVRGRVGPGTGL